MQLIYAKNMTDQSVEMRLYQAIGRGEGIDGAMFAEELHWLAERVPLIKVRINSPGGSIFEGYSIYAAMREAKAKVNTYNDFVAASMAGIIFQQGEVRHTADNSVFMMHNPSGGGDSKKDKEVLGILKNSLVDSFVSRTGKDGNIISDLMDVETWVEARMVNGVSPMIEMGLADKIFQSSVKINSNAQVFNAQKLYSFSNNILKKDDMENEKIEELTKQLGDLSKVVDSLKKEKEDKDEEIKNLKKQIEDKDAVLKEATDKAAIELVENAIKEGKIKADKKDSIIEDAKKSFSVVKNMLDGIQASTASRFTNFIGAGAANTAIPQERSTWTIRDWDMKDPKGLKKLREESPEVYQEMYNQFYNK